MSRVRSLAAKAAPSGTTAPASLSAWGILLLLVATFGSGMAAIVPMSYTLTVRLDQIAPGNVGALGLVLGVGSAATLVFAPLTGSLSDRTRSRWGRRRPFTVLGVGLGILSVPIMAFAPNVAVLTLGWILSTVGWGTSNASIGNWQADRLPPAQRGKVSGLGGLMMQIAPVLGIVLVGAIPGGVFWLFALPAGIGLVTVTLFVLLAAEEDNRHVPVAGPLTLGGVLRSYGFNPRAVPDFAWNWLGRFIFYLGMTCSTSFTVYFVAQRLSLPVAEVSGFLALSSVLSIGTALLGSIGGGWLSDRTGRRKPLVFLGAFVFAGGAVVMAFAHSFATLVAGTLVNSVGIAVFSAVGQALVLDVLPDRDTQAGRYMAINLFAQKIPGVVAPLAAPMVLVMGSGGQNFTLLYFVTALLACVGGVVIAFGVRGVR